jgi:hypothetical protein
MSCAKCPLFSPLLRCLVVADPAPTLTLQDLAALQERLNHSRADKQPPGAVLVAANELEALLDLAQKGLFYDETRQRVLRRQKQLHARPSPSP